MALPENIKFSRRDILKLLTASVVVPKMFKGFIEPVDRVKVEEPPFFNWKTYSGGIMVSDEVPKNEIWLVENKLRAYQVSWTNELRKTIFEGDLV